ncbi:hypothetical protein RHSIM_Rhsim12G0078400 [Rhododendron simsii]|uniref:4-hydroxy-3-methylbut-2-enyl diphosphate reductase n=1 Tax=Rhododendron simsii TaxID=118357 RepID=A0A834L755_RHOSS|nr:hypothetical protein RHSIM_Rhsim12G0078400 [Rhododendron simsii]
MLSSTVANIPIGSLVSLPACGAHGFSNFAEKCWVCNLTEQMLRLLHEEDVDFINADGRTMNKLLLEFSVLRYTRRKRQDNEKKEEQKRAYCLVTIRALAINGLRETPGQMPQTVAKQEKKEELIRQEGTFNSFEAIILWVMDIYAYFYVLYLMQNWSKSSLLHQMNDLATRRKLEDLIIGPVLTFTTKAMLVHVNKVLQVAGSKLLFGGDIIKQMKENGDEYTWGNLTVKLAESYGFCLGVERAFQIAYEARKQFPEEKIWITNKIIHNPTVNKVYSFLPKLKVLHILGS